jgi:xylitol oxidase
VQEDGDVATGVTNWAGNYSFASRRIHQPATLDELRAIVSRAPKIHALGTRHSFNDSADGPELISLEGMPERIEIDRAARTVTVNAAMPYGTLAQALEREGLALHNMASLPHISIGGATATATHGSGDRNGNLSTAVSGLELVTSDGDIVRVSRGDGDFNGMVVHVGALGVVTSLTLDLQPSYLMRQEVYEHLPWEAVFDRFDEVMGSADSVSIFTTYGKDAGQLWRKSRVDPDNDPGLRDGVFGAIGAKEALHPAGLSAENCTEQLGVPGPWADRLSHFRMDAVPASGNELQAEYMVARRHAVPALRVIKGLAPTFQPHLWVSEIRTVAADELWLSSSYGVDTVCLHFSFKYEPEFVDQFLPVLEAALAPFDPRPHWGKLFTVPADAIEPRYERLPDFRHLADRLDPRGAFRSPFLERTIFS